jgi:L,D-transpeptidase catalytic domain
MSPASTPLRRDATRGRRRALPIALSGAIILSAGILLSQPAAYATPSASAGAGPPFARVAAAGPPTPAQAWVAKVLYPTLARTAPSLTGARRLFTVAPVSAWGAPTELLVLGSRIDAAGHPWLRVRLDYRPNGFAAWIDEEDTILHEDPWRIAVSRARREVRVYDADRLVRTFAAVVGKPATPTPAGLFAIAAELPQGTSKDFEGTWVLPLTAHSEVLRTFEGGDGQVALHGRGGASLLDPLGSARSHGCVRLANAAIGWIADHVPVGTPVRVR